MKNNFLLTISFVCIICFTSCDKLNIGKKKLEFYYYPSKNVYYDVANNQYVYSVNGGKTWDFFKPKNNKEPATLGNKQIIYSDSPQPWNLNQLHRKEYNGTLLAMSEADTSTQQDDAVSDKKIIKKVKPVVQPKKEEEKKPGFFKRIFGKKHQQQ